jgi:lipid-binding SYLF domain-containing protein
MVLRCINPNRQQEVDLMNGGGPMGVYRWMSRVIMVIVCLMFVAFPSVKTSSAASAKEIDEKVDLALDVLRNEMQSGLDYLNAKAVLIIPHAFKVGFVVGGEYGEGVLRIHGKTVDYYCLAAGSLGFQFGVQARGIVLAFMEDEALKKFRESSGWKVGADGSVVLLQLGVGGFADTATADAFIIGHVFGQEGLMVNVSLEGAKFTKLKK